MSIESFPRLSARSMNFQLGLPRGFDVSPDGARIVFVRAATGTSRSHELWVYDVATRTERRIADPERLLGTGEEQLTAEERSRRERMRVGTAGVVAFSTDRPATVAAFALSSRLFIADLVGDDGVREIATLAPVIDPRLSSSGRTIAYAGDRGLHVVDVATGRDRLLVGPDPDEPDEVVWGLAEFIAAEELDRARGFWWAPDGESLIVERYDETPVPVWHISDPAHPDQEPVRQRYPQAGKANALVSLVVVSLSGDRVDIDWRSDRELDGHRLEYLAEVDWTNGQPVLALLTRDQTRMEFREVDTLTGATRLLRSFTDDAWVELLPGTPRRLDDGRLLYSIDEGETRRLLIDGHPFTPEDILIRRVEDVGDDSVTASVVPSIGSVALARLGFDGTVRLLSDPAGFAVGAVGGDTVVVAQRALHEPVVTTSVLVGAEPLGVLESRAERSPLSPNLETMQAGSRDYPTTVLFPTGHVRGSRRLPVLMDPYGGPHGQRVVNAAHAYLESQWFADQGFVVIVADGRGMAGRGPAWDRLAKYDRVGTIDDQAEVLGAVAELYPDDLDTTKVGIRGWSFGGYLAALGVLRRADVFGAAVAGAPVSDERLYDTCYAERYLGHPDTNAEAYDECSLLPMAADLSAPLMLIHGLADDNVAVAHTLRLSSALLAAGKPHTFLPLTGTTHMANSEVVAENLLVLQVDFLKRALSV